MDKKFNFDVKTTYIFSDDYDMVLVKDHYWVEHKLSGMQDSIGRNFHSFFTYKCKRFLESVRKCWVKVEYDYSENNVKRFFQKLYRGYKDYYYQGYRHPSKPELKYDFVHGMSRDHLAYTILLYKLAGVPQEEIRELVDNLRFRISDFSVFTPDLWLWSKAMAGYKFYEFLYKVIILPISLINLFWNKILYWYVPFTEEYHQKDFYKLQRYEKTKRQLWGIKSLYRVYALNIQAWQLFFLKDTWLTKLIKKVNLEICPKHNYYIKMLLGKKDINKRDIIEYRAMTSGRWSGILNPTINVRDTYIIEDPKLIEYNNLDKDMLTQMYDFMINKNVSFY